MNRPSTICSFAALSMTLLIGMLMSQPATAQNYVRDTLTFSVNDTVALYAPDYEGNIQWQVATTQPGFMSDTMFSDLEHATHDTLQYILADSVIYVRAKVTVVNESNSCTWFSDIYKLQTLEALPRIILISPVDSIEVDYNTPETSALNALPQTTSLLDSDSSWHTLLLDWSAENYSPTDPGKYQAEGTFTLPDGVVDNDTIDTLSRPIKTTIHVLNPRAPQVQTTFPPHISSSYALVGGEIISDGGSAILEKGILWDTTFHMAGEKNRLVIDDTAAAFRDTLKNLRSDTRYYLRAYAINAVDTSYGLKNVFDTPPDQSNDSTYTIYFSNPYDWDQVYAYIWQKGGQRLTDTFPGRIMNTSKSNAPWYRTQLPLQYNRVIFSNGQEGIQTPELTINETAWFDGEQWHEQEPDDVGSFPLRDADGNQYETVIMGNQVWMAENLRATRYSDGTPIDNPRERIAWASNATGAYCWYHNDSLNYAHSGALYNWYTIDNNSGLCPDGWKIPDNADWTELAQYISSEKEFQKITHQATTYRRSESGVFREMHPIRGWSATATPDNIYASYTQYNSYELSLSKLSIWSSGKNKGYNVRCIKESDVPGESFIPTVKTLDADSLLTHQSALLQGELQSTGGSEILEYGFYYDTVPTPQLQGNKHSVMSGTDLGGFSSEIRDLIPGETYYYRAFATNKRGQALGFQSSFHTPYKLDSIPHDSLAFPYNTPFPVIQDSMADSVNAFSSGNEQWMLPVSWDLDSSDIPETGTIRIDGNLTLPPNLENPDYLEAHTILTIQDPVLIELDSIVAIDTIHHSYSDSLGDVLSLLPDTTQIIDTTGRILDCPVHWVMLDSLNHPIDDTLNVLGSLHLPPGYKQQEPAKALTVNTTVVISKMVYDYDGHAYDMVQIGNQVWMAENLKATHYADGLIIQEANRYESDTAYGKAYGNLYSWQATLRGTYGNNENPSMIQGVCPEGWHVPSQAEWQELIDNLGGTQAAGGWMKSTRTVPESHPRWESPNSGATNRSGFHALPGGIYIVPDNFYLSPSYQDLGYAGYWWTATDYNSSRAHYLKATYNNQAIEDGYRNTEDYLSVRCVKD